jgi:hypothetical protein
LNVNRPEYKLQMEANSSGRIVGKSRGVRRSGPGQRGEIAMYASVGAASAGSDEGSESDEARRAARDERAFFLVLAAVITLEGYALAWFLG